MLDSLFDNPYTIAGITVGLLATVAVLRVLRRRGRTARRVEGPNSSFDSHLARDANTRHRWHDMTLDRLHEINREEVTRLLAKVDATSPEALNEREREFLDHMAKLAGSTA